MVTMIHEQFRIVLCAFNVLYKQYLYTLSCSCSRLVNHFNIRCNAMQNLPDILYCHLYQHCSGALNAYFRNNMCTPSVRIRRCLYGHLFKRIPIARETRFNKFHKLCTQCMVVKLQQGQSLVIPCLHAALCLLLSTILHFSCQFPRRHESTSHEAI